MTGSSPFSFGRNWQRFLPQVDDARLRLAVASLQSFLSVRDLHEKRFLDIGCGSGLFSYAAHQLGAAVVSVDADPDAVDATRRLWERTGSPLRWQIVHGSVLHKEFLATFGDFDIVYSWGVLHHTGQMWQALQQACRLTRPGGVLAIALYNRVDGFLGSRQWRSIKRFYTHLPALLQRGADGLFALALLLREATQGRSPRAAVQTFASRKRGMEWWTNVRDWLGGYPYEYATVEEVRAFMHRTAPTFTLTNLRPVSDLRNNEYLFRRES